jgi:hypothetical protein
MVQHVKRIGCVHMSGLFDAVAIGRWPRWRPRRESAHEFGVDAPVDPADLLSSWIDRSHHLLPSGNVRHRPGGVTPSLAI